MTQLTLEDHHRMHQEGWCVDLHEDGFRIHRIPATKRFKDDADAWTHVFERAYEGELLATKALAFLANHGPLEFQAIGHYMAIYRAGLVEALRLRWAI